MLSTGLKRPWYSQYNFSVRAIALPVGSTDDRRWQCEFMCKMLLSLLASARHSRHTQEGSLVARQDVETLLLSTYFHLSMFQEDM